MTTAEFASIFDFINGTYQDDRYLIRVTLINGKTIVCQSNNVDTDIWKRANILCVQEGEVHSKNDKDIFVPCSSILAIEFKYDETNEKKDISTEISW